MTDASLDLAPGCFGGALTYRDGSSECATCMFAAACKPAHERRLIELREKHGIKSTVKPRVVPRKIEPNETALVPGLPKKVQELMGRIERKGIKVTEALRAGVNPFVDSMPFLKIVCHVLLNYEPGIDRTTLVRAFMQKLGWTKGTADAHATQAFQLLIALGAAEEVDGRLKLKRS